MFHSMFQSLSSWCTRGSRRTIPIGNSLFIFIMFHRLVALETTNLLHDSCKISQIIQSFQLNKRMCYNLLMVDYTHSPNTFQRTEADLEDCYCELCTVPICSGSIFSMLYFALLLKSWLRIAKRFLKIGENSKVQLHRAAVEEEGA